MSEKEEVGFFNFSTLDFIILLMLLTLSGAIGIVYGCFGKTQMTSKELLIADRKMGVFPASMSLLAGFLSGASLLGIPSEIYYHGTMYLWNGTLNYDILLVFLVDRCRTIYKFVDKKKLSTNLSTKKHCRQIIRPKKIIDKFVD